MTESHTLSFYVFSHSPDCRSKEQELQELQRSWSATSQQEGSQSAETQRAKMQVKALEGQLRDLHSRITQLQADTR